MAVVVMVMVAELHAKEMPGELQLHTLSMMATLPTSGAGRYEGMAKVDKYQV